MYKKIAGLLLGCFVAVSGYSQTVSGVVTDVEENAPIPGVNIYWENKNKGTTSEADGTYVMSIDVDLPENLIFSFVGFQSDTVFIESPGEHNVVLSSSVELNQVEVSERVGAFNMSSMARRNTEEINRNILRKAACCNLSESFETSASVDVVLNDAVSGTRKIQMLGLEGVYVQNLFEGIPFTRGLSNVLGFDQIPGSWLNTIQLTKGVGSVQNGYESLTGQINLEFIPPDVEERIYVDLYANSQQRYEGNVIWAKPLSARWSTALFLNGATQNMRVDNNDDGFLDMPLRDGFNVMNRWKYFGDYVRSQIVFRYLEEERTGGQTNFNFSEDFGSSNAYGIGIDVNQLEVLAKTGFLSKERDDRSLGLTASLNRTEIQSYFGNTLYSGEQISARFNSLFNTKFSEYSDHSAVLGFHYLYDEYRESFADSSFGRIENVPGVFAEYTYERPRFTAIGALRWDAHNLFGNQISPRVHLKYNLKPLTTLRGTIGRGFRTPNAFADQLGYLASSRQVSVLNAPNAESSWNTGVSLLHKFEFLNREIVFTTDYYFTYFENQLVVDRDTDPRRLLFYNLDGESYAHSFQTEIQAELTQKLGLKVAYKFQDVQVDYLNGRLQKPLVPRNRVLMNLGYSWDDDKWIADFTANYYGKSRLPKTSANPEPFQRDSKSKEFFILHAQLTRILGKFEVYVGAENIGNFIQPDAIVDPENPFGTNFDASLIYGPVNGRVIYAGVRMDISRNK
ncbi:MAG: TonB-dependent receptor [Flavobacteriales bacterium]|nr:TonB-dependent receptor [Flavobacteriales bacterium]